MAQLVWSLVISRIDYCNSVGVVCYFDTRVRSTGRSTDSVRYWPHRTNL